MHLILALKTSTLPQELPTGTISLRRGTILVKNARYGASRRERRLSGHKETIGK
jgi:hypothetical protein